MSMVSCAMRARLRLRHEMQGAHVVQAVGKFDEQHARIVGDGEQKLSKALGLLRVFGREVELVELGQSFDEAADLRPEHAVDVVAGDFCVFDGVVQHRSDDRRIVELEIGEDGGDFERMGEIGIAGGALLRPMRFHGEHIGAIEQIFIGLGIVTLHPIDQLVLPDHLPLTRIVRILRQYLDDESGWQVRNAEARGNIELCGVGSPQPSS